MGARLLALAGVAALAAAGLIGCPSLEALTSTQQDGGGDSAATTDSTVAQDSGMQDTSMPDTVVQDTGLAEVGAQETSALDAGAEAAACVFVDAAFVDAIAPPDAAACTLGDGSTCTATYEPSYLSYLTLAAPKAHVASCTGTQISNYLTDCPIPYPLSPPSSTCATFVNDTTNAACVSCLTATPVTNTTSGAIVYSPFSQTDDVWYNYPGCIEMVAPCDQACAQAIWAGHQCPLIACYPVCTAAEVPACAQATGNSCLCAAEGNAFQECLNGIMANGGPAAQCLVPSGVLAAFCGGM